MLRAAEAQVVQRAGILAGVDAVALPVETLLGPLHHASAYVSGFLAGGAVDAFFRNDLPHLALEPEAAYHALFRAAPDLEQLVTARLVTSVNDAFTAAARGLDRRARAADVAGYDLDVGLGGALDTLAAQLRRT